MPSKKAAHPSSGAIEGAAVQQKIIEQITDIVFYTASTA